MTQNEAKKRGRPSQSSKSEDDPQSPEQDIESPTELKDNTDPVLAAPVIPQPQAPTPESPTLSREAQWRMLDQPSRDRLGMSYEEFLAADDVTGMGPNSRFTPPEER